MVVPLYEASITSDRETAKLIFDEQPDLVRCGLCRHHGITLHVASIANETKEALQFIKNLVNMMTKQDLELKNQHSNTAFWIACATGKMKMAMIILKKNPNLLEIRDNNIYLPLSVGAMNGTHNIVKWLYDSYGKMSGNQWSNHDKYLTLWNCVDRGFFDVALQIVKDHQILPQNVLQLLAVLATKRYAIDRVKKNLITRIIESYNIHVLACRFFGMKVQNEAEDDTDALKLLKIIWNHATTTMSIEEVEDMVRRTGMLFEASKRGNTRFIIELLRTYPDFKRDRNEDGLTIFRIAVMHRHHEIYNLLYEIGSSRNDICILKDHLNNDNLLHLVGRSSNICQEVYKIMPPSMREEKNNQGQTPYDLFSKENKDLLSKGLKWMRDCMVVATLIITVAFAAAFTIPGGYKGDNGLPFFIHQHAFLVFVIADAIFLFSSSTSILGFLSILTSRQEQHDFIHSLPSKLMTGLLTLLMSVAAMMVTLLD
ncbi:hypothetical protein R6Q59_029723 [Mikania micrantha]